MDKTYPLHSYKFVIMDIAENNQPKINNYPTKEYEIWIGSYLVTGMEGNASKPSFCGKEKGRNFQDACFRYFLNAEYNNRQEYDKKDQYFDTKRFDYDPYTNTYWGCTLYESKEEAFDNYNKNWK